MISSRTPEGQPHHCPLCQAEIVIEPSHFFGDANCPQCNSLMWFLNLPSESLLFDRDQSHKIRSRIISLTAKQLDIDPQLIDGKTSFLKKLGADSLDTVELFMELENVFDLD